MMVMLFFCRCCRGLRYIRIDGWCVRKNSIQSFSASEHNTHRWFESILCALTLRVSMRWIQCEIDVIFSIKTINMQNYIRAKMKSWLSECWKTFSLLPKWWPYFHSFTMTSLIWMPFHELLLWNVVEHSTLLWIYGFIWNSCKHEKFDRVSRWRLFDIKMKRKLWFWRIFCTHTIGEQQLSASAEQDSLWLH